MEPIYLFVYGSLRKGFKNHTLLTTSEYHGEYTSVDNFQMITYKRADFPYLLEESLDDYPTTIIHGEIYKISPDVLQKIDRLEDNTKLYQRKIHKFISTDNQIMEAWVYILIKPEIISYISRQINEDYFVIKSGDWYNFNVP